MRPVPMATSATRFRYTARRPPEKLTNRSSTSANRPPRSSASGAPLTVRRRSASCAIRSAGATPRTSTSLFAISVRSATCPRRCRPFPAREAGSARTRRAGCPSSTASRARPSSRTMSRTDSTWKRRSARPTRAASHGRRCSSVTSARPLRPPFSVRGRTVRRTSITIAIRSTTRSSSSIINYREGP